MGKQFENMVVPFRKVKAPTQHNSTNEVNGPCRGILATAAGTATIVFSDGTTYQITFAIPGGAGWATGVWHPVEFVRINDTNTSLANADMAIGQ